MAVETLALTPEPRIALEGPGLRRTFTHRRRGGFVELMDLGHLPALGPLDHAADYG